MGGWQSSTGPVGHQATDHYHSTKGKGNSIICVESLYIRYSIFYLYFSVLFLFFSQGLHLPTQKSNNNPEGNVIVVPVDESKGAENAFQCE